MKYQKGDYVLIEPSVLDQKFKQASGPSIVCITCNNGGNLEAFLFYRPDQIFCQANKTFYEREVLFSNDKIKCSVDDVVGRCHVLAHRDYHAGLGVEDVPEEQVYICVSRYSAATKSISTIRRGHKQLRDFCLVPKTKDKRSMTKHKITQWKSVRNTQLTNSGDISISLVNRSSICHFRNVVKHVPKSISKINRERKFTRRAIPKTDLLASSKNNEGTVHSPVSESNSERIMINDLSSSIGPLSPLDKQLLTGKDIYLMPNKSKRVESNKDQSSRVCRKRARNFLHGPHSSNMRNQSDDSSSFSEDEDEESGEDIHDDDNRDDSENVDIDGEDLEQRNQSSNLNSLPSSGSDDDNCDDTETYFADHKSSKIMSTSDHTLAKMDFSRIDGATIRSVKLKLDERTIRARNEMMMTNYSHFDLWNYQLKTGYNLLFYGFGTKKNLIMDFATKKLQNSTRLVINGYFPSLTIKEILLQITQKMFGFESSFLRISEHLEFIEEIFRDDNLNPSINGPINNKELYLLINNIDGAMLRDPVSQNVFRTLAKIPQIHLVASIDHINATLIWDQGQLSDFNWLWYDCTTFERYNIETSYESSLLVCSNNISLLGAMIVLQSLTKNGRKVFWIILKYQLKHCDSESEYRGISFSSLLNLSQQQFAAHDDSQLRTYLTEFTDHKLMIMKKRDGMEFFKLDLDSAFLEALEEMMIKEFENEEPSRI